MLGDFSSRLAATQLILDYSGFNRITGGKMDFHVWLTVVLPYPALVQSIPLAPFVTVCAALCLPLQGYNWG